MSSFSARARKLAFDSPSRSNSFEQDDSVRSNSLTVGRNHSNSSARTFSPPARTNSDRSTATDTTLGSVEEEDEASTVNKAPARRRRIQAGRIMSYPIESEEASPSASSTTVTPNIRRIKRDESIETFIKALEEDGGVIVEGFADVKTVDQANAEVKPWLDQQRKTTGVKVGALAGKTRTLTRLIMRSPTVREQFFADSLYQALVEHFLTLTTTTWYGDKPQTNTSYPLLSIAITFDIPPGTPGQAMHRDDKNHHARHTASSVYTPNRDVLLGLFVAGTDTSPSNGATRVIPRSHLWDDSKPDFDSPSAQPVDVSLRKGDALILLGSLYHAAGAYLDSLTENPELESRTVHAMFCCTGVHRQEEVSFLSYPIKEVKTYSKIVRDRLGWKQSEPNLGWVDLKSPEFLLEDEQVVGA